MATNKAMVLSATHEQQPPSRYGPGVKLDIRAHIPPPPFGKWYKNEDTVEIWVCQPLLPHDARVPWRMTCVYIIWASPSNSSITINQPVSPIISDPRARRTGCSSWACRPVGPVGPTTPDRHGGGLIACVASVVSGLTNLRLPPDRKCDCGRLAAACGRADG